jgi:hypothetical protein
MNLKSHGIIVDCKNCNYISDNENGGFDIAVPIKDKETGIAGSAKLHCTISHKHHSVELKKWQNADHKPIHASEDLLSRVSATLESFADQRICGNCNICPSKVVQIVEEKNIK